MDNKPEIICVTGPMASGKNYICSQMEKDGWISIDADILVHKAIEQSTDKILSTFEPFANKKNIMIKNSDGSINRRNLGKLIFSNKKYLKLQENIVYPIITSFIMEFLQNNKSKKIIINATVLYKTPEVLSKCTRILFVTAPFFTRFKRAYKRDKMKPSLILQRFFAQKNLLSEYKKTDIPIEIVKNK